MFSGLPLWQRTLGSISGGDGPLVIAQQHECANQTDNSDFVGAAHNLVLRFPMTRRHLTIRVTPPRCHLAR